MKTRNLIKMMVLMIAIFGLTTTSCKKDKTTKTDTNSLEQLANDNLSVQAASDEASNDVDAVLGGGLSKSTAGLPCNATLDSTSVINDTITYHITYNGLNCNGTKIRTGQVEIKKKANVHWGDVGAFVSVRHINFNVVRVGNGKSTTLNGTKIFTNVSGGVVKHLGQNGLTTVVHRVQGSLQVTFDDGSIRTWNVARQKTFTGTPGNLILTVDGFGTSGSYTNLAEWGTNRHGEDFFSQITQSVVHRQQCGWDQVSGIRIHSIPSDNKSATITFGYDSNNLPITGSNCPTKYRIDWQKNGNSGTIYKFLL